MSKTNQNIKKVLRDNEVDYSINSELENNIMNVINEHRDYSTVLLKTKRKLKISLIVSLALLILYIGIICFGLFIYSGYDQFSFKAFYPSVFTVIVVVLVYFEMIFGISVLKK